MSDWLGKAEDQLKTHAATLRGLGILNDLAGKALDDPGVDVYSVIKTVARITQSLIAGFAGKMTPDEIEAQFKQLPSHIAENDQAADSALDAKFNRGGKDE